MYAALAFQKNRMAVYLMAIYLDHKSYHRFESEVKAAGKRIDAVISSEQITNLLWISTIKTTQEYQ